MGNTAERVLDQVNCSVLTIKPEGFQVPAQSGRPVRRRSVEANRGNAQFRRRWIIRSADVRFTGLLKATFCPPAGKFIFSAGNRFARLPSTHVTRCSEFCSIFRKHCLRCSLSHFVDKVLA